jgi:hypothetical protein
MNLKTEKINSMITWTVEFKCDTIKCGTKYKAKFGVKTKTGYLKKEPLQIGGEFGLPNGWGCCVKGKTLLCPTCMQGMKVAKL